MKKIKKKEIIKYSDSPRDIAEAIDSSKVIKDFLPSPDKLVLKEKTQKITINLSKKSLDFFKNEAKKYNVSYQKMIKNLIDKYSDLYQ